VDEILEILEEAEVTAGLAAKSSFGAFVPAFAVPADSLPIEDKTDCNNF
jgi:hypothetical protein